MFRRFPVLLLAPLLAGQTLPGTSPLTVTADPARRMVDGIHAWLERASAASRAGRKPESARLRSILGVVDERVPFEELELLASSRRSSTLLRTDAYTVHAVRWPVLDGVTAEGLYYEPARAAAARVVAIPDADQEPEQLEAAARLASQGCDVLVPVLIDRKDTWSGDPRFRMTNQPHREYIYRMAFPVGRHIVGYEVQKVLAAVDWFARRSPAPIGVWGYGEGGLIALSAAALDSRIEAAVVSGYFQPREQLWREPIFRNIWGVLKDFGDAEMAALAAPRRVIVETRDGPRWDGPPRPDAHRRGAAPGVLAPAPPAEAAAEVRRARGLGARIESVDDGIPALLQALGITAVSSSPVSLPQAADARARMHRQLRELIEYTQAIARDSAARRDEYWAKTDMTSADGWLRTTKPYRDHIWDDVIGRLPAPAMPVNARSRLSYHDAKWDGYEVMLDVFPDVFAYGVLLLPKDLKPGERRPVVVAQHGLEGRPQFLFSQPEKGADGQPTPFRAYQNVGSRLAGMGFIVYLPQNPYIGQDHFRLLQRRANPLGLSIFSFILAQNQRLLEWLATLPFVDAQRIGFYGLSYGGKTALRIPPLLDGYALSICSGDFNEWIVKLTTVYHPFSYMFTPEWEMPEWNLGQVANHAELARLMAPRPFMVERGHRDGVANDEWVAFEYAKVQRFYDELGIGDRARIEFFNGPHRIHGVGTFEFLRKFLQWPK